MCMIDCFLQRIAWRGYRIPDRYSSSTPYLMHHQITPSYLFHLHKPVGRYLLPPNPTSRSSNTHPQLPLPLLTLQPQPLNRIAQALLLTPQRLEPQRLLLSSLPAPLSRPSSLTRPRLPHQLLHAPLLPQPRALQSPFQQLRPRSQRLLPPLRLRDERLAAR